MTTTKKPKISKRTITATILLMLIIPFFLFASLPQEVFSSEIYDYFFISTLSLFLLYFIFEITNFVVPHKINRVNSMILFLTLSLIFMTSFLYLSVNFILNDKTFVGVSSSEIFRFLGIILISLFSYLIISTIIDTTFQQGIVALIVSTIGTIFTIMLVIISFQFYWNVLFLLILTTVISDTTAYYIGKNFGKNNPFPNISPNKTEAGLIGGFVCAVTFAIVWYFSLVWTLHYIPEAINWKMFMGAIVTCSLFAPFGDLFFSKIKRSFNKKDFSNILPEHGGVLDRIDSHIFAFTISSLFLLLAT